MGSNQQGGTHYQLSERDKEVCQELENYQPLCNRTSFPVMFLFLCNLLGCKKEECDQTRGDMETDWTFFSLTVLEEEMNSDICAAPRIQGLHPFSFSLFPPCKLSRHALSPLRWISTTLFLCIFHFCRNSEIQSQSLGSNFKILQ